MKSLLFLSLLAIAPSVASAHDRSWVFQQSYYSHDPVSHVRIGRQFSRGPVYTRPQGEFVNSGYRHLRSTIQLRGQTYDHLNMWESWYQVGQQF